MDYELEIVSKNKIKNRVFKRYELNGIDTIGVKENESFAIRFNNNTHNDVQIRLSIDGTDIVTGELATTNSAGKMWFVRARDYMEIDAWPETNSGGARLIFGKENNSVAKNTHGNMSAKGLIAAAIFVESKTYWIATNPISNSFHDILRSTDTVKIGGSYSSSYTSTSNSIAVADAAVGAGEYTKQTITKAAGLASPKFKEVLQLRYEWWNKLRETISQYKEPAIAYNAFPGDKEKMINLKNTPRVKSSNSNRKTRSSVQRFV